MTLALANQAAHAAPAGLAASVTTVAILGALGVAGEAIAWREHRANVDLRAEVAAARSEAGSLRGENQRPAAVARTVEAHLRADLFAAGQRAQRETDRAVTSSVVAAAPALPSGTRPVADFKNASKASPSAAIGQMLWAASSGDLDQLTPVIALDPAGRTKVEETLTALPESTRQQYGSPEKLVALLLAHDAPVLRAIQVIGDDPGPGEDNLEQLDVRMLTTDGDSKKMGFHFRRFDDGRRAHLPPDFIENVLLPKLTGRAPIGNQAQIVIACHSSWPLDAAQAATEQASLFRSDRAGPV